MNVKIIACSFLFGFLAVSSVSAQNNFMVEEAVGSVQRFDEGLGSFAPVQAGDVINKDTLIVTGTKAELLFSCVGGMAGRISENTRVVLKPAQDKLPYEADLNSGTVAILLDPNRLRDGSGFSVRTSQGVTMAKGTFYAVTKYKGQTYTKVKHGDVKRKLIKPKQKDFAAYGQKTKTKPKKPAPK